MTPLPLLSPPSLPFIPSLSSWNTIRSSKIGQWRSKIWKLIKELKKVHVIWLPESNIWNNCLPRIIDSAYYSRKYGILKGVQFSLVFLNESSSFRYGSKDLAPSFWQKYMEGSHQVQKLSMSIKVDDVTRDTRDEAPHWRLLEATPC